jgi:hypothetical protein
MYSPRKPSHAAYYEPTTKESEVEVAEQRDYVSCSFLA